MEVILLERVAKHGQMGDIVKVKDATPVTSCCRAARRCAPPPTTAPSSST